MGTLMKAGRCRPLRERFWERVARGAADECWLWLGFRNWKGYGRVASTDYAPERGKYHMAHRVAWELAHGPIPEGMFVCHRCDNPPCCNPAHLFLGTATDNMRDMWNKGRGVSPGMKGERHPMHKLDAEQVLHIRAWRARGEKLQTIADHYGVTLQAIHRIVKRKCWRHLPEQEHRG